MPPSAAPSLFYPFRALGYVSEGAPFAVQRRGTETFVTVSAGKAWQIYNCDKLRLVMVGPQFGDAPDIRALAAKGDLTFAAVGRDVAVCRRSHRLCTFEGHAEPITHLFVFGGDLISVCSAGRVLAWDISKDAMDYLDGKRSAASRDANRASQAGDDDDSDDDSDDDDDDDSDSEDDTAALLAELERIKKERADAAARREADDAERDALEKAEALASGNPLLDLKSGAGGFEDDDDAFVAKRRWDDDVVFKNQTRGEPKTKKRFVNDTIRSDFHRRFLNKYVK